MSSPVFLHLTQDEVGVFGLLEWGIMTSDEPILTTDQEHLLAKQLSAFHDIV